MRNIILSVLAGILLSSSLAVAQSGKEEIESLPDDFSLSYFDELVGITPAENSYTDLTKNRGAADGSFTLTTGVHTIFKPGGPKTKTPITSKRVSKEQCLALYKDAVSLGFFELNKVYVDEKVKGGVAATMSITADGKTMTVRAINVQVPEITALMKKLRALLK